MIEKIALLHNHFDQDHLNQVVEEMKKLGAPTIRVYDCGFDNIYQALEGCHRLRACEILNLTPVLEFIDGDVLAGDIELDCDYDSTPVCELGDWGNYQIIITDDKILNIEQKEEEGY